MTYTLHIKKNNFKVLMCISRIFSIHDPLPQVVRYMLPTGKTTTVLAKTESVFIYLFIFLITQMEYPMQTTKEGSLLTGGKKTYCQEWGYHD